MSKHVTISPMRPRIASPSGSSSNPTHTAPIGTMQLDARAFDGRRRFNNLFHCPQSGNSSVGDTTVCAQSALAQILQARLWW
jgi:hypothetical protein